MSNNDKVLLLVKFLWIISLVLYIMGFKRPQGDVSSHEEHYCML